MLDVEIIDPTEVERAAAIFHRDGFVPIKDALNPDQLTYAQSGAARVIAQQMKDIPLEEGEPGVCSLLFRTPAASPGVGSTYRSADYSADSGCDLGKFRLHLLWRWR